MRSNPLGNGSVRLQLTPEVHHGAPQQRIVGDNHNFIIETKQTEVAFDQLLIECVLAPGETLVLSCTSEFSGLGRHFFVEPDVSDPKPKIVLIRLAQSQFDDLFAADQILKPIATQDE